ncbi:hypothetical protein MKY91_20550 [Alkalicoccobacillus gibsonii]|uniref:Uncharacterized protein n=1 Tax=Alkalicoccobacillus gibsonii TaxID=79881 RepID=A0ABU9VNT7_9BACI
MNKRQMKKHLKKKYEKQVQWQGWMAKENEMLMEPFKNLETPVQMTVHSKQPNTATQSMLDFLSPE